MACSLTTAPPQIHLVDQHYTKEFQPHLSRSYSVVPISGNSEERDFFGKLVKDSDVVICTAQILYNAMTNTEEDRHVELSGKYQDEIRDTSKSDFTLKPLILSSQISPC